MNNNIPALTKPRYWIRMHCDNERDSTLSPSIFYDELEALRILDKTQSILKSQKFRLFRETKGIIKQQKTWLSQAWLCLNDQEKLQAAQDLELLT